MMLFLPESWYCREKSSFSDIYSISGRLNDLQDSSIRSASRPPRRVLISIQKIYFNSPGAICMEDFFTKFV